MRCGVMRCVAACCSGFQRVAACCSVLQRVAACCSVLQHVAMCCCVLQCTYQEDQIACSSTSDYLVHVILNICDFEYICVKGRVGGRQEGNWGGDGGSGEQGRGGA